MGESSAHQPDPVWDDAWRWVTLQHENAELAPADQAVFAQWLAAAPEHQRAYADASQLWLISGLVPPVNDFDVPGCEPPVNPGQ